MRLRGFQLVIARWGSRYADLAAASVDPAMLLQTLHEAAGRRRAPSAPSQSNGIDSNELSHICWTTIYAEFIGRTHAQERHRRAARAGAARGRATPWV